ncbi:aldehyde dehydrogenase family protein [Brachybacterium hainanense]|uniref:Aldehyde dehydrogenase n=1 Tax=Brachybacterium hainanense TaxID=1541174 RepID=A0ABV6RFP2_9MICO
MPDTPPSPDDPTVAPDQATSAVPTSSSSPGGPARTEAPAVAQVEIAAQVAALRAGFRSGRTRPLAARLAALDALARGVREHGDALREALREDLGKHPVEADVTEIGPVLAEIAHVRRNLRRWLVPRPVPLGALLAPGSGRLHRDPLGTVLVIAPWNYPVNLSLMPLIGAIAGGNTAILKPSEVAPASSAALAALIGEHLDPAWVQVREGGVPETTALLAERFDLVFYTGGGPVAKIVAHAAAEHLTPVVLELGGKSPVFVDEGTDLAAAARRIIWGKLTNAGQTCVAPDHLMATRATLDALVPHLRDAIRAQHGADPRHSPAYGRIVNQRHTERLAALIDPAHVVIGGQVDIPARYVAPTVLDGVRPADPCMGEEIFGPILPLLEVSSADEAIARIEAGDAPLTAYVFSPDAQVQDRFVRGTRSGSLALDVTLAHLGAREMPFGGVGASGSGAYHGRASLEAFTHAKPVVRKPLSPDTLRLIQPPYSGARARLAQRLLRG